MRLSAKHSLFITDLVNTDWNPPEDDAEFVAWLDNFVEILPRHAKTLGIPPEDLEELRKHRADFRAAFFREIQETLAGLRRRLNTLCSADHWPAVLVEAFARVPITREPDRSG